MPLFLLSYNHFLVRHLLFSFKLISRIPMVTKPVSHKSIQNFREIFWLSPNLWAINARWLFVIISHYLCFVWCALSRSHFFQFWFLFCSILRLYFSLNISQGKTQSNVHTTLYSTIYKWLGDFRGFDKCEMIVEMWDEIWNDKCFWEGSWNDMLVKTEMKGRRINLWTHD